MKERPVEGFGEEIRISGRLAQDMAFLPQTVPGRTAVAGCPAYAARHAPPVLAKIA